MQQKKEKENLLLKGLQNFAHFLFLFFADSDGKQQLKSKLDIGGESNLRSPVIPRRKQSSSGAKWNTVRGSRFSLCNLDFS